MLYSIFFRKQKQTHQIFLSICKKFCTLCPNLYIQPIYELFVELKMAFPDKISEKGVNTIRVLSADMIQKAASGHPGLPMGAAPAAYTLWKRHLKVAPAEPEWINRDRFVLSAGHGSALLYSMLHLAGYGLSMDDLKNFRQLGSRTPGHPEFGVTPGVDASTGPLGQGVANAVGMAIAERMLAARFNKPDFEIIDHYTYVLLGDGCMMEGIASESASLAGHLKLGKLILLYDSNNISLDGPTSITFTEDVKKRFESYGFQVLTVADGDKDLKSIDRAIAKAKKELSKPTLIIVKTTIGFGSPNKAGSSSAHGSPLGNDELAAVKKGFGMDSEKFFFVDDDVKKDFASIKRNGGKALKQWKQLFAEYSEKYPEEAAQFKEMETLELKGDIAFPKFEAGTKIATRSANGKILAVLGKEVPWLVGGDADLSCSTKTAMSTEKWISADDFSGKNIHFGVREHAMGAVANGIFYHGMLKPYTATFFSFADYMRPPIRLAALAKLGPVFIFTHDSLAVGEDGPTHQPVEQLATLRCVPGLTVIRPADANEVSVAWKYILENKNMPVALILTRQDLPVIDRTKYAAAENALKGGYAILEEADPELILIATGSEVHIALAAAEMLKKEGLKVRVVNMVSRETFEKQPATYRESVLPKSVGNRIVIEAGTGFGWEKYSGEQGKIIAVDTFGTSAPGNQVMEKFGFTAENIVKAAKAK